jgi:PAS domain S-box-containing protein
VNGRDGSSVGLAERGAERVARMYATLSMAYEAIVRIRQRLPLFEHVCRVLVEEGQLRMAWVGEVDDQGWIVPIAHAGVTDGYLDQLRISVCDVPEGRGPTGTAARELRHMLVTDIATDERMAPWREAALARGYRSSAAFPLVLDGRCVAVLTAYAPDRGFFDEQQVELFDRLAADLSFASEAMEREERRRAAEAELRSSEERSQAAEAQLRSSEERFRAAAGSLLDSFTIVSPVRDPRGEIIDFRHEYVNDAYCALVGFDRERLVAHRLGELFPRFPGSDRFAVYRRVAETGEPCRNDAVQGEGAWAGTPLATRVIDTVIVPLGENLVVSARDVTDRKRDEQELRLRGELLELAHDAVIVRDPLDSRVRFWNREAEKIYGYSREEATGRVTHELLGTEFPESEQAVEEALAREGRWDGELRQTRKDGTVIIVSSRQALARDEAGGRWRSSR